MYEDIRRQAACFDSTGKLFGYEFLYRDSDRNEFNMEIDGSMATCLLLSNMLSEFGLENLTGGVYAFVNLTQELLRNEYISIMDPKHFIIEILEDINDDSNLESTLAAFREKDMSLPWMIIQGKIIRTGSYRFRISSRWISG